MHIFTKKGNINNFEIFISFPGALDGILFVSFFKSCELALIDQRRCKKPLLFSNFERQTAK